MKTAAFYAIIFLLVFTLTVSVVPSTGRTRAPARDEVEQTPWQNYEGAVRT